MVNLFNLKKTFFCKNDTNEVKVYSPVDGESILLSEVNDPAFSDGTMGQGCAVIPYNDEIYSPISGKITSIFPTFHAIGITGNKGEELLLHIGVNTVELNGEGFSPIVKENAYVDAGALLLKVDFELIKRKGYSTDVIVTVLNSDKYEGISCKLGNVSHGEILFTLNSKS